MEHCNNCEQNSHYEAERTGAQRSQPVHVAKHHGACADVSDHCFSEGADCADQCGLCPVCPVSLHKIILLSLVHPLCVH